MGSELCHFKWTGFWCHVINFDMGYLIYIPVVSVAGGKVRMSLKMLFLITQDLLSVQLREKLMSHFKTSFLILGNCWALSLQCFLQGLHTDLWVPSLSVQQHLECILCTELNSNYTLCFVLLLFVSYFYHPLIGDSIIYELI